MQKTAYEMRISDWSSDVCSSDLLLFLIAGGALVLAGRGALGHGGWLDGAGLDLASALFALILVAGSWLLFRAVGIAVVGLFADATVADVEARQDRKTSELQSLMRISYAVFCLTQKYITKIHNTCTYTESNQA